VKLRILMACCAALALTVGVATATAGGGNSEAAKACQKGGWQNFIRSEDGSSFKNQGDCVSYAAKGGTLTPKTAQQRDCESFGGEFVAGPASESVLWSCRWSNTGLADYEPKKDTLQADCFATPNSFTFAFNNALPPVIPGSNWSICFFFPA
jgi:hypothetical protein